MANAANSPFVKHPALLALFAPRPRPPFKTPMPTKSMPKLSGIAQYTAEFGNSAELSPPKKYETPTERKTRIETEKDDRHKQLLSEREKQWDPHNNPNATKDPYKTLFVARLSFDLTEDDLRREFERYGRIRDVKLILDKTTQKSRGYAFIEFERSNDLKEAFQHADGHKLKGRRILVDVERGRTVKTWKPRKLGGGLGKTRAGPDTDKDKNALTPSASNRHSSRAHKASTRDRRGKKEGKYSSRRDKYRDRDYRDRGRSGRDRGGGAGGAGAGGRERKRSRSRSRERKDRPKRRDREKKDVKERDGRRDRVRRDNGYEGERNNVRKERNNVPNKQTDRDRDRPRRRRSRSKEKTRRR